MSLFDDLFEMVKDAAVAAAAIFILLIPITVPVMLINNYRGIAEGSILRNYGHALMNVVVVVILPLLALLGITIVTFFISIFINLGFKVDILTLIPDSVSNFLHAILPALFWWITHWYLVFAKPMFWVVTVWAFATSK